MRIGRGMCGVEGSDNTSVSRETIGHIGIRNIVLYARTKVCTVTVFGKTTQGRMKE